MAQNTIVLNWQATSQNEEGFNIYKSLNGSDFTYLDSVNANVTSYTAPSIEEGQQCWFRVAAYTYVGESAFIQFGPFNCYWVIEAPSSLVLSVLSGTEIQLGWQDNSNNENNFYVYKSIDGINFDFIASLPIGTITYIDLSVSGQSNWYRVSAYSDVGESAFVQAGPILSEIVNFGYWPKSYWTGYWYQNYWQLWGILGTKFINRMRRISRNRKTL